MGRCIIEHDGRLAVWSSVVDNFITPFLPEKELDDIMLKEHIKDYEPVATWPRWYSYEEAMEIIKEQEEG